MHFACWHTSLQLETLYQNDWSVVINQIEYTDLIKLIFSLFIIYLNCNGPALHNRNLNVRFTLRFQLPAERKTLNSCQKPNPDIKQIDVRHKTCNEHE